MKTSKEIENIAKALHKYKTKHKGNAIIHCCVIAFKGKNYDCTDDRIFAFGTKEQLLIGLEGFKKEIKKQKSDFVDF